MATKVVIIGGGASGLMAAVTAARAGAAVNGSGMQRKAGKKTACYGKRKVQSDKSASGQKLLQRRKLGICQKCSGSVFCSRYDFFFFHPGDLYEKPRRLDISEQRPGDGGSSGSADGSRCRKGKNQNPGARNFRKEKGRGLHYGNRNLAL